MSSECYLKALGRERSPCAPQDHSSVGNRDPQASAGILIGNSLLPRARSPKWTPWIDSSASTMLIKRIISLAFVALLAVGLGASVTRSDAQPFAGMAQANLSATPSPDCSLCKDCERPCARSIGCGAQCVSPTLTSAIQVGALHAYRSRLSPRPDWQLASADLLTPTPPPKLSTTV